MTASLEKLLQNLDNQKNNWVSSPSPKKISYLQAIMDNLLTHAPQWVALSLKAKGIDPSANTSGQEILTGPYVLMRSLRLMKTSLENNYQREHVRLEQKGERVVARVMPLNALEAILWKNASAEIWIEKNKPASQGTRPQEAGVCLVLGAGNVSSIAPLDALYKLYHEGVVCLVKLNPVNDYLCDILRLIFAPLIEDGFLDFVKADTPTSSWLCEHALVTEIHLTGSHHTHDAVVWGSGEDAATRRRENTPKINKKVTSELGCVTPVIVIPGVWSKKQLAYQARHVVSMVENNAGFNCNAAKVLVLYKHWPQREEFLQVLRAEFAKCPARVAYYPGAAERQAEFQQHYPQCERLGASLTQESPWLFIPNVAEDDNGIAFQKEAFCGLLAEVSLEAKNEKEFFSKSTDFCNHRLWGTLSATILIHPDSEKKHKAELESMLENLRYGALGVNAWAALCYALGVTSWGGYPGHTLQDVKSGIGTVHNDLFFDFPEKSIVRCSFTNWPTPVWFYDAHNLQKLAMELISYEYKQDGFSFLKVLRRAVF
jgi:acyl-CoA reductase-like NAD-dependent aldehyde dehydrogenase